MRALILVVLLFICAACNQSGEIPKSAGNKYDSFTSQFGTLLIQKNFAKAYMLTSLEYQKNHTAQQMQQDFEKAQTQLAPGTTLTQVQVDHGELPSSDQEAKDTYAFPPDIIQKESEWKNWNIAKLSDKDGHGFSVFHLVMDDGSGPKVGFIYYDR